METGLVYNKWNHRNITDLEMRVKTNTISKWVVFLASKQWNYKKANFTDILS